MDLIAQASVDPISSVFLQYGILGAVALLFLLAIKVLYSRVDEDRNYHRQRADQLAEELRTLNASIREQHLTTISRATEALNDVMATLDGPRRGGGRDRSA